MSNAADMNIDTPVVAQKLTPQTLRRQFGFTDRPPGIARQHFKQTEFRARQLQFFIAPGCASLLRPQRERPGNQWRSRRARTAGEAAQDRPDTRRQLTWRAGFGT